jgi:hypothetical protein
MEMNGHLAQCPVHARYTTNIYNEQVAVEETLLRPGKEFMLYYSGGFDGEDVKGPVNTDFECVAIPFKKHDPQNGFYQDSRPGNRLGSCGVLKTPTKATSCDLKKFAENGFSSEMYEQYMKTGSDLVPVNVDVKF